jgi:hypothetical protein
VIQMGESDDNSRLARSQTDPLWLQDHFLGTGHDVTTRNGTASFVSFHGRQFAVTCRHVMKAASDPKVVAGARHPTAALQIDNAILNLSSFTAAGLHIALSAPDAEHGEQEADVAIAELTGSYWGLLTSKKGKRAIDLDSWKEPNWAAANMCAAAGYPDEHKEITTIAGKETVAAKMLLVAAEVASPLARDQRIITLSSRLEQAHGYFFSGISGGALYIVEDDGLVPAGIVFEGYPSTKDEQTGRANSPAFLDENDIFIRALTLTPEIFHEWLERAKLTR